MIFKNLIIAGAIAILGLQNTPVQAASTEAEAIMQEARLIPMTFDPAADRFAYRLKAKVRLGNNPCQAEGVEAEFRQQLIGQTMEVSVVRILPESYYGRICTFEYRPVYVWIAADIAGSFDIVNELVLKNIGEYDSNYSLDLF